MTKEVEYGLGDILRGDAGVGAIADDRIYPHKLPQNPTFPAITYSRVSGAREKVLKGLSGLARPTLQYDCWAERYTEVKSLADAVRAAFDGYQGTVRSVRIDRIQILNEVDDFDTEVHIYRVSQDYEVFHAES